MMHLNTWIDDPIAITLTQWGKTIPYNNGDIISINGVEVKIKKLNNPPTKSNWTFERSSGYAGWRCQSCMKWVYLNSETICGCDDEAN